MATLNPGRKAKAIQKSGEFGGSTVKTCFFWRTLQSKKYASPHTNARNETF